MQAIFEFLPLILFLGAYLYKGIYFAIATLMVAMPVGFLIKYIRNRTVDRMYLWSTIFLPLVRRFLEMTGELPTERISVEAWRGLNLIWVAFFVAMGIANIYVAYNYSEQFWVNFKVFGLMALTFVFMLAQGIWLVSKLGGDEAVTDAPESD
jgi:intracellular septation protein